MAYGLPQTPIQHCLGHDETMNGDGQGKAGSQKAAGSSSKGRLILLVALVIGSLIALAGGVGFYWMARSLSSQGIESEGELQKPRGEAIYVDLAPPFTVNFQGSRGPRFLQISVEVMTRQAEVRELLKQHMPVIRSQLILLFSSQSSEELDSREGKEKLIQETLATIQRVLEEQSGKKGVEAVYFTSLVMQ